MFHVTGSVRAASLVLASTVVLAASMASVSASPGVLARTGEPTGLVGQSDRQLAVDGYVDALVPALDTPVDWNGSVSPCNAGTPQQAEQQATLRAINYMRSLVGAQPVTLSPDLSARALDAATMMLAERTLSHAPGTDFACYTAAGAEAAGRSNLYLGMTSAAAIAGYMVDPGANNTQAGHRRWIIDPRTRVMGSGSTIGSNALWVINMEDLVATAPPETPAWLPWPSAGYFPAQLEPQGRWSLSATDKATSFSGASVAMVGPEGPVALTVHPAANGYGPNSVVWDLAQQLPVSNTDRRYTVTVSGIAREGTPLPPVTYDVVLARAALSQITAPALAGAALPGQSLTVSGGMWRPAAQDVSIYWSRDGKRIAYANGPSYQVTEGDAGTAINASVRVAREGFSTVTVHTVAVQIPGMPVMRMTSQPRLLGVPRVGRVLEVTPGRFRPSPTTVRYRWLRDGKAIRAAKSRTYRLRPTDRGHKIKAKVTVRRAGFRETTILTQGLRVRN